MTDASKPAPSPGAMAWTLWTLCLVQTLALACCLAAPFTQSRVPLWVGVGTMSLVWLLQWANRVTTLRNLQRMPLLGHGAIDVDGNAPLPRVTLFAAARNEEAGIERAIRSMAALHYPALELVVVDDHSTDSTPAILDRLAEEFSCLRVLHGPPPQPGWVGKQNALDYGLQKTNADSPWLVITDADIVFGPEVLREAVAYAESNGVDFLTSMPFLEIGSLWEELVLVPGWLHYLDCFQYPSLNKPNTRPLGIGAFMLARREVFERSGGWAAIAREPLDDLALARSIKQSGAKMDIGWAGDQIRCRQYPNFGAMFQSLVRKQRVAFADRTASYLCAIGYLLIQWVLPLPLALVAAVRMALHGFDVPLTIFAASALVAYVQNLRALLLGRYLCELRWVTPAASPLSGLVRIAISLAAMVQKALRRPLNWRGRDVSTP